MEKIYDELHVGRVITMRAIKWAQIMHFAAYTINQINIEIDSVLNTVQTSAPHSLLSRSDLFLRETIDREEALNSAIMRLVELREEIQIERRRRIEDNLTEKPVTAYGVNLS